MAGLAMFTHKTTGALAQRGLLLLAASSFFGFSLQASARIMHAREYIIPAFLIRGERPNDAGSEEAN
jgi:hypothetical protein